MELSKIILLSVALAASVVVSGFSQTLQTLYQFGAQPPNNPYGGVVLGPDGNYYGTTYYGGAHNQGTIYRLTPSGSLTNIFNFSDAMGTYPYAGLLSDSNGNFYGTTQHGGAPGYGTIFRVTTNGVYTVLTNLYSAIGANPQAALIWGSDGKLYGTTYYGGAYNAGTVFQITTNGTYVTLASFNNTNGANPSANLFLASDGNFYGTTPHGGPSSFGTVFQLTPSGTLTDLGSFDFVNNGLFPASSLVQDGSGNLYGTTTLGGGGGAGQGALFEIPVTNNHVILGVSSFSSTPNSGMIAGGGNIFFGATSGGLYKFNANTATLSVLYNFSSTNLSGAQAAPILTSANHLVGTTVNGGSNGYGAVYDFNPATTNMAVLYSFSASAGAQPIGGLVQGSNGTFFGTTSAGGSANNGTVFSFDTNGVYKTLVSFASTNGAEPEDTLLLGTNGFLYGTARIGGGNGSAPGTVFRVSQNGQSFTNLAVFNPAQAAYPQGGLIQDRSGNFYGTSVNGGAYNYGAIFKIDTNNVVTTLANFNLTNGENPECTLVLDNAGYLWGTTAGGGPGLGFGTIFRVSTNGIPTNTFLVPFATFAGTNGSIPVGGLTLGPDGNYYGTTEAGGKYNYGNIYRCDTNGVITSLVSFAGGNGAYPVASLCLASNGVFYGTTSGYFDNQTVGQGTVFRVRTNGDLTTFATFNGTDGASPEGPVFIGADGTLYGTTANGGVTGGGTLFKLTLGPILPVPLQISSVSNLQVLTWTNPVFTLQSTYSLTSTFTNVPDSFSPYTNRTTSQTLFYRLHYSD